MGERRWLVITQDGRHTTLGRHSDPSSEDLDLVSARLRAMLLSGWLAVSDGGYYTAGVVTLMMVRPLHAEAEASWDRAATKWEQIRAEANRS